MKIKPFHFPSDFLRLLYLVLFKPVSLDRYIHQVDSTLVISSSLLNLWTRINKHQEFYSLVRLTLVTPLLTFPIIGLFVMLGFQFNWIGAVFGIILGLAISISGITYLSGVVSSIAISMFVSVAGGVGFAVVTSVIDRIISDIGSQNLFGIAGDLILIMIGGVALGTVSGMAYSLASLKGKEKSSGILLGFTMSLSCGGIGHLLSLVALLFFGLPNRVIEIGSAITQLSILLLDISLGVGILIGYFRLVIYLFEILFNWVLSRWFPTFPHLLPVLWDELIWLPLPNLNRYLVAIGKENRAIGLDIIAAVAQSFRQGWAAQEALVELLLYDIQNACTLEAISAISESLSWLPSNAQDEYKSFLGGIEEISKISRAALYSDTLYNRQEQLRHALVQTRKMREGLAYYADAHFVRLSSPGLEDWENLFEYQLTLANQKEQIPNVYVAGSPLAEKSKVFKGRRDVFRALEFELATESEQRPAILLFGARRVGKSSVLRQLPVVLGPRVVPVMIDMQSMALTDNAAALFGNIAKEIKKSAFTTHRLELPEISAETLLPNPYLFFAEWLKQVEAIVENRWVLLSIDEYEYLEKMLLDGHVDVRAFQLLRSLLQNYPHLTVLFSGSHTFEELSPVWSHHLINVRVLRIGHLEEQEARELIEHPIQPFPLSYSDNTVKQILKAVTGQPYLLQAVCRDLVNLLNETNRFEACTKDIEKALESTLTSASAYFKELWSGPDSSDSQRAILTELAKQRNQPVTDDRLRHFGSVADIRKLVHHDVIEKLDDSYHIKVELFRRWIENQL